MTIDRDPPHLSLVFPVFNEEKNLDLLVEQALRIASGLAATFEIILVDDGSTDRSGEIATSWAASDPRVRIVRHSDNRGYGAALAYGLREAVGDLVFFSDADLQFDLRELATLLEHARSFDIVTGYRSPRRDPWPRGLIAWLWGRLVGLLFGLAVRDINCAFKVFHRRVLETMPIASAGAFVNAEILLRAQAAGYRIHQVPVTHRARQRGRQSGASPKVMLRALRDLMSLRRELQAASGLATAKPAADLGAARDAGR